MTLGAIALDSAGDLWTTERGANHGRAPTQITLIDRATLGARAVLRFAAGHHAAGAGS